MHRDFDAYLFGDGSAGGKRPYGAWAAIACHGGIRKVLYGTEADTTVSRCELKPIIEGLRYIRANWRNRKGFRVCVISDSEYTVKTLAGFYQKNKNLDLWAAMPHVVGDMAVSYIWRERNTLPYMTECDRIAGDLRRMTIDGHQGLVGEEKFWDVDLTQVD